MTLLRLPSFSELVLPFAVLIGTIGIFLMLSRSSELVVLRAAGISVWQFTLPAMIVAFLLGIGFVLLYNPIAAVARGEAERLYAGAFGRGESLLKTKGAGAWLREDGTDGPSVIHAAEVLNQGLELNDVTVFQYDRDHGLTERIEAKRAVLKDGRWELDDAWVSAVGQEPALYKRYLLSTYLTPDPGPRQPRHGVLDLVLGSAEFHSDRREGGPPRHPIPRAVPAALVAALPARDHGADRRHLLAQGIPLRQRADQRRVRACRGFYLLRVLRDVAQLRHGRTDLRGRGGLGAGDHRGFARAHRALVQRGRMMAGARTRLIGMRRAPPGLAASKGRALGRLRSPLFACVLAAFAVALAPWQPAFGQAQTSLEQIIQPPKVDSSEPMLLQADEMIYDNDNSKITAKGNVEIYYGNYTLLADRVVYDRATNTLAAEGNVRIKDPDGAVITADQITLTDDFRDGFIDALKLVTKDDTRIVASSASRQAGNVTVFEKGWFTPCKVCEEKPSKPPTWRIRAGKITHKRDQATITFRNAFFDFFGVPVIYVPWFQMADPTVKRKSGFLMPSYSHSDAARHHGPGPLLLRAVGSLRLHLRADVHREGGHPAPGRLAAALGERRLSRRARRRVGRGHLR